MPSKQRQLSIPLNTVPSGPLTIFHQLPQSHQQQLAYLIADLIRRMYAGKQNREGDHER